MTTIETFPTWAHAVQDARRRAGAAEARVTAAEARAAQLAHALAITAKLQPLERELVEAIMAERDYHAAYLDGRHWFGLADAGRLRRRVHAAGRALERARAGVPDCDGCERCEPRPAHDHTAHLQPHTHSPGETCCARCDAITESANA